MASHAHVCPHISAAAGPENAAGRYPAARLTSIDLYRRRQAKPSRIACLLSGGLITD